MRVKCGVSAGPRKNTPSSPNGARLGNPEEHEGARISVVEP